MNICSVKFKTWFIFQLPSNLGSANLESAASEHGIQTEFEPQRLRFLFQLRIILSYTVRLRTCGPREAP
ncbi:hypothetical protein VNO77_28169 [Canavalia gladiata]|uniref:Uncharacterized protein n=1 Tax=Canavalia gladiata TaxID=3824 RepID=A0AAN9KZ14_CANGL